MPANLAAVVLAAGASSRMGRPKALLSFHPVAGALSASARGAARSAGSDEGSIAPAASIAPQVARPAAPAAFGSDDAAREIRAPLEARGRRAGEGAIEPAATFLGRLLHVLAEAGVSRIVVVVSAALEADVRAIAGRRARVVVNPAPERGQLSSLVVGLDALERELLERGAARRTRGGVGDPGADAGPTAFETDEGGAAERAAETRRAARSDGLESGEAVALDAIVSAPVDVPLVAPATVRALVEAWMRTRAAVVRPADGSRHGHPVVFDRALFGELRRAVDEPDGARAVVRRNLERVLDVAVADQGAFVDIDGAEDYRRVFGRDPS